MTEPSQPPQQIAANGIKKTPNIENHPPQRRITGNRLPLSDEAACLCLYTVSGKQTIPKAVAISGGFKLLSL